MNIHGYCTSCHKIKRVRVTGNQLAILAARGGTPIGICDSCRDKK